jgi:hypothetical protein
MHYDNIEWATLITVFIRIGIGQNIIKGRLRLINELRDEAHRQLCPFHIGTSHSTLIIFAAKIMCMLKFYQGTFLPQCSSRKRVVDYVGASIHTVLLKWEEGELEKTTAFPVYFPSTSDCCVGLVLMKDANESVNTVVMEPNGYVLK